MNFAKFLSVLFFILCLLSLLAFVVTGAQFGILIIIAVVAILISIGFDYWNEKIP